MSEKRTYIVYDSRAEVDTDDALVYVTADTLEEARRYVKESFPDGVIFSYRLVKAANKYGCEAVDERREF